MAEIQQHDFNERGGRWVLAQAALLLAALLCGWRWHGDWQGTCSTAGGGLLLLVAAGIGAAGAFSLGRHLTPFPRPNTNSALVQTGIYGLIRHPLYTSVGCASFGWALLRASSPAMGVAVALALFFDAKARREERWLRQQFPEYDRYAGRVRRFIPGLY